MKTIALILMLITIITWIQSQYKPYREVKLQL